MLGVMVGALPQAYTASPTENSHVSGPACCNAHAAPPLFMHAGVKPYYSATRKLYASWLNLLSHVCAVNGKLPKLQVLGGPGGQPGGSHDHAPYSLVT
jgi:hypothetical protein